jgi:hypothetical protein
MRFAPNFNTSLNWVDILCFSTLFQTKSPIAMLGYIIFGGYMAV